MRVDLAILCPSLLDRRPRDVLWKNSFLLEERSANEARVRSGQNSSAENCRTAEDSRTVMRDNLKIAFPNDKYNGR